MTRDGRRYASGLAAAIALRRVELGNPQRIIVGQPKGTTVKIPALVIAFALVSAASFAENGKPSGQGSTTGDPAANSQSANPDTTGMTPNRSGSGTSSSGGKDNNGDRGRDKMPESNMDVKQQPGKPNIPNPGSK
jgi:hypothetical protein